MFRFVSSGSLGASHAVSNRIDLPVSENTSLWTGLDSIYFNVDSGNLHVAHNDLTLSGLGLDLNVNRYYNAQDSEKPWRIAAADALHNANSERPSLITADGALISFHANEEGVLVSFAGNQGEVRLTKTVDAWCMETVSTGERQYFDKHGKLISKENAISGRITYEYQQDRLSRMTNASGQSVQIVYDDMGNMSKLVANGSTYVEYYYDALNRLSAVNFIDVEGGTPYHVKYAYEGDSNHLVGIDEDDGHALTFGYQVNKLQTILTSEKQYQCQYQPNKTTVNHQDGRRYEFLHENHALKKFSHFTASSGQSIVRDYAYDDKTGYLVSESGSDGTQLTYTYSDRGWLTEQSRCVEFNTYQTDTFQHTDAGQVAHQETVRTADSVQRSVCYFYELNNPYLLKFKVTAENQVTEYVYDEKNQLTREYRYIARFDMNEVTPEMVEQWAARPGQKGNSELIAYFYNTQGDLFETKRYANLHADGTPDLATERVSRQETDLHGRVSLVHNFKNTEQPKRTTWDPIGRKTEYTNFFNQKTTWTYASGTERVDHPSGLHIERTLNRSGQVLTETEIGSINGQPEQAIKITTYAYQQGNLYCVDEHDVMRNEHRYQYNRYDPFNRPCLEIDQDGYAVAYTRDERGNPIKTTRYSTKQINDDKVKLTYDQLQRLLMSLDPAHDRIEDRVFDADNRIRFIIDPMGNVTETVYNAAGKIAAEIRYAVPFDSLDRSKIVSLNQMMTFVSSVWNHSDNRATHHYYDADGFESLTIQPNGSVIHYLRDALGNVYQTDRFANTVHFDSENFPSSAMSVLEHVTRSDDDISEYNFYNKCHDCVAHIDGEGYLEESRFDNHGDEHHRILYRAKPAQTDPRMPWSLAQFGLDPADPDNIQHWLVHDAEHRLLNLTDQYQTTQVTEYGYWDEPDAAYVHHQFSYSTDPTILLQARGVVYRRDCRGDIYQSLGDYGIDAILHDAVNQYTNVPDIWKTYATTHQRDGFRRVYSIIDNQGNQSVQTHSKRGDLLTYTNAEGEMRSQVHNAFREIAQEIIHLGDGEKATTTHTRNYNGQRIKTVDPEEFEFDFLYNTFDECVEERIPISGGKTRITVTKFTRTGKPALSTQNSGNLSRTIVDRKYDAFDRVLQEVDGVGQLKKYSYDKRHLVKKKIYVDANVGNESFGEEYTYDASKRETVSKRYLDHDGLKDEQIRTTAYSRNVLDKTITASAHGRTSVQTIRENAFGDVIEENLGSAMLHQCYFDPAKKLTRKLTNGVLLESNTYDSLARRKNGTSFNGTKADFDYDKVNRETKQTITNPSVHAAAPYERYQVETTWGPFGMVDETTALSKTRHAYTRRGDEKRVIEDAAEHGIQRIREFSHDALHQTVTEALQGPDNHVERLEHHIPDDFGRLYQSIIDPEGLALRRTTEFDAIDRVQEEIDPLGRKTLYRYADHGHRKLTIRPSGYAVLEYFNLDMNVIQKSTFLYPLSTHSLNDIVENNTPLDAIVSMLGGLGHASTEYLTYSADQLLLSHVKPSCAPILYEYNNAKQKTKIVQGDRITSYIYDQHGHMAYEIDPEQYVTRYIRDAGDNVLMRIRYANRIDTREHKTVTAMDSAIALIATEHDRFECHIYDMLSRELFTLNAEGLLKQTRYDELDHVTDTIILDVRFTIPVSLTSSTDAALRAWISTAISAPVLAAFVESHRTVGIDHTEQFVHDGLGRVECTIDSFGHKTQQAYNLADDIIQVVNRLGGVTDKAYDNAGRLKTVWHPAREVTLIDPNVGTVTARPIVRPRTEYTHDAAGQLTLKQEAYGTSQQRDTSYGHDLDGNCERETLKQASVYDAQNDSTPAVSGRVEKTLDLSTVTAFDAFKQWIRRETANGAVAFQIFGLQQEIIYTVDPEGYVTHYRYDDYLNQVKKVRYNIPISPESLKLIHTKMTPEEFSPYITSDPAHDRTIDVTFDRLNRQVMLEEASEVYFDPRATNPDEQFFDIGKSIATQYNAFDEVILQRRLVNPYQSRYASEWHYHNRAGDVIALIDADLYMVVYSRFSFNHEWREKTEYSQPLLQTHIVPNSLTPPAAPAAVPEKDRSYSRTVNGEGLVSEEIAREWVVYEVDVLNHGVVERSVDKHIAHTYDAEFNEIALAISVIDRANKTVRDQRVVRHFFNQACLEFAQLDTKRELRLTDGSDIEATPLTYFGYNYVDDKVVSERLDIALSLSGESHADDQQALVQLIQDRRAVVKCLTESYLRGNRGEILVRYQANGCFVLMSYDATLNMVKEWFSNAYYTLSQGKPIKLSEQHTTVWVYSLRGFKQLETKYDRDAVVERYALQNAFGEVSEEQTRYKGVLAQYVLTQSTEQEPILTDSKVRYIYNRSGMITKTNAPDGVWKLQYNNPLGHMTGVITSQVHHLAQDKFTPGYIKNLPVSDYQYTEYHPDNRGNVLQKRLPQLSQSRNPLFSTVVVGSPELPEKVAVFGQYAAIWKKPTSFQATARFKLRLKDSKAPWQDLPVAMYKDEMGVNLSAFVTDLYDYKIEFFHITDNPEQSEIPYASGQDVLAVVNENQAESKHLVFKMETGTRMVIAGRTHDEQEGPLTGLEIIPEIDPRFFVGVTPRTNGTFEANFDHVPTGAYKARRADMSVPIGSPFTPIPMSDMNAMASTSAVTAFFTDTQSDVMIDVREEYFIENDADEMPEGVESEDTNHVFRYHMTINIRVQGNPSPADMAQTYRLEVLFSSGKCEVFEGPLNAAGEVQITRMIYEECVPVVNQKEPPPYDLDAIRERVDYPVAAKHIDIDAVHASLMSLKHHQPTISTFKAAPSFSAIEIGFKPSKSMRSGATDPKPQRYIHVNHPMSLVASESTDTPLAIKISGNTIGPKQSSEGYQLYDISNINTPSLECQFMGPKLHDVSQLHEESDFYVDTRVPDVITDDPVFTVTSNMFLSMTPFLYSFRLDQWTMENEHYYSDIIVVSNKLPPVSYNSNDIIEYNVEYLDTAGQLFSRSLPVKNWDDGTSNFYVHYSSDQTQGQKIYDIYSNNRNGTGSPLPIESILPRFYGMYNPPIRASSILSDINQSLPMIIPRPISFINLRIFNSTRRMMLYNAPPFEFMGTIPQMMLGFVLEVKNDPGYRKNFNNPDFTYYFNTQPALTDDIVSMKVYYDGQYRGYAAINRIPDNAYAYSVDLRNYGIVDQSRISFQWMSPSLVNNYIIENPPFEIRSTLFQRMTVTEFDVNVLFIASQSMYLKKKTESSMFGKTKYYQWAGENSVTTGLELPDMFRSAMKQVNFHYILQSMTGAQDSTCQSGWRVYASEQMYDTFPVYSPPAKEPSVPAQLLPYPQGVTRYDMNISINNTSVRLYTDYPNRRKYYVMIKPLPEQTERIELQFRAEIDSNAQHWDIVQQNSIIYQRQGLAIVDATGLPIARYQYRLRAFDGSGKMLDLSAFAASSLDKEGFAYGQFIITRLPGRTAQVPPPGLDEAQTFHPIEQATYDFQSNLLSETDAAGAVTEYVHDKQNVRTKTVHPTSTFIKREPAATMDTFQNEKLVRSDMRYHTEQTRFVSSFESGELIVSVRTPGSLLKQVSISLSKEESFSVPVEKVADNQYKAKIPDEYVQSSFENASLSYETEQTEAISYRDTSIPADLIEETRPEQYSYPNAFGEVVGTRNPNGHLHLFHLNGAGFVSSEIWPDKSKVVHRQNIFGFEVYRMERAGLEVTTTHNGHGAALRVSRGPKDNLIHDTYELDTHDRVIMHQDPDGGRALSRFNSLQQATHLVDSSGIQTVKLFDIQGNTFVELFADGLSNKYYRDVFGYIIRHIDRANIAFHHQYNFVMMPVESVGDDQSLRPNAHYDENQRLPRQRMLHRYYGNNLLYMTYSQPFVTDGSSPILDHGIMMYRYDTRLLIVGERYWMNGIVWKDMVIGHNALRQAIFIADIDYRIDYGFDRAGNTRATTFKGVNPKDRNQVLESVTLWSEHNDNDEMTATRLLRDGQGITYESSQYASTRCTYENGRMRTQKYYDDDLNRWILDDFRYGNHGYVSVIRHSDERETLLTHSKRGMLTKQYTQRKLNTIYVEDESTSYTHKLNGALTNQHYRHDDQGNGFARPIFDLRQHTRNAMDTLVASQQEIYAHINEDGEEIDHITHDLVKGYANFKSPIESYVNMTTTFHEQEQTSFNATKIYFTEFGSARRKKDAMYGTHQMEYISIPNSEIVYRAHISAETQDRKEVARTSMFNGRVIAQYNIIPGENVCRWEIDPAIQPFADNPMASQPMTVEVTRANMTLVDVAKEYCFGRADAAGWLQQQNPQYALNEVLSIGTMITIPYGQSTRSFSYAAMLGNTTPLTAPYHVELPKPPNPWKTLIPMAIGTIVSIVVMPQFTALFGEQMLGFIAASAAASAAGNLSAQATANLLDVSNGFDWESLATTSVMSAMAAGIAKVSTPSIVAEGSKLSQTFVSMQQAAMLNMAQQSYLLATGQQEQFHWENLVANTVMGGAQAQVDAHMDVHQTFKDVTLIMMTQVMNEQARSMRQDTAFRGSNIFMGAAQSMAMYGVAQAMNKTMIRWSQPKTPATSSKPSSTTKPASAALPTPGSKPPALPKTAPAPKTPVPAPSAPPERAPIPSGSGSSSSRTRKEKTTVSKKPDAKPVTSANSSATVTVNWERTNKVLGHVESATEEMGKAAFSEMMDVMDSVGDLKGLGKYVKKGVGKITTTFEYGDRAMMQEYRDSSATSRMVCAAVGVGGDLAGQWGVGKVAPLFFSPPLAIPAAVALAPAAALVGEYVGDQSQSLCHKLFKQYE